MIIKVCGVKTKENIDFLSKIDIDMIGLNFYKPSVRFISEEIDPSIFDTLPNHVKRVGVFVNETPSYVLNVSKTFKLDYVQLHGDEDAAYCDLIAQQIQVIKVFRIDETFDFAIIKDYKTAKFYLFDTQTKHFGGSGKKFNWDRLNGYKLPVPFLLSGGIGPEDYNHILNIKHPQFSGIDINSKFESSPGIKDHNLVLPFIKTIKSVENK